MSTGGPAAFGIDPFGPAANPSAYVPFEAAERARIALESSIAAGRVAALVGPPGLGKTLLLQRVRARESERREVVYVPFCTLAPDDLFALILSGLGDTSTTPPRDTLLARAGGFVNRGGVLVLVDDASALPLETARALADLLYDAEGTLHLVLAAVEGEATQRVCDVFAGQLDVVQLSEGLSELDARRYVETRLAYAGARPELVAAFDEETIAGLHHEAQGVPRRLNHGALRVLRRAAPDRLPRLRDALERLVQAQQAEEQADEARAPAEARERTAASPPQRAAEEGHAPEPPESGAYRLVRGRPVAPELDPTEVDEPGEPGDTELEREPAVLTPRQRVDLHRQVIRQSRRHREAQRTGGRTTTQAQKGRARAQRGRLRRRLFVAAALAVGAAVAAAIALGVWSGRLDLADLPRPRWPEISSWSWRDLDPRPPSPLPETAPPSSRPEHTADLEPESSPGPSRPEAPAAVAAAPEEPPPAPEVVEAPPPALPPVDAAPPPRVAVSVNAIPWAVVEIDGRAIGETPLAGIELAPGPHTFRAQMPDGNVREQTVEITPERRTVVFE